MTEEGDVESRDLGTERGERLWRELRTALGRTQTCEGAKTLLGMEKKD